MSLNKNSPDDFQGNADFLKALGHPVRLCILYHLLISEISNVGLMQKCINIPQSTISQHLSILRNTGIVAGKRKGNQIIYSISDQRVEQVLRIFIQ